jgi:hypothetical protein
VVVIRGGQTSASIAFGTSFCSRDIAGPISGLVSSPSDFGFKASRKWETGERVVGQKKYKD